jgi:hypothetical protein
MSQDNPSFDTIIAAERPEYGRLSRRSLRERGELLSAACRNAAEIESSRLRMGLPPTQPAPRPESTWSF